MSLTVATWIGAIATMVLAAGAIVTVYYARKAFREQAEEVRTLKRQLGEQSREAGLLERQIRQQQDFNELQAPVLTFQAQELRESLDERKRAQAAHIYFELGKTPPPRHVTVVPGRPERDQPPWRLTVTTYNASTRPVYDLELRWQLGHQRLAPNVIKAAEKRADRHRGAQGAGGIHRVHRGDRPGAAAATAGRPRRPADPPGNR